MPEKMRISRGDAKGAALAAIGGAEATTLGSAGAVTPARGRLMAEGFRGAATTLADRITNEFLAGLLLLVVIVAGVAVAVKGFAIYVVVVLAVVLFAVLLIKYMFGSGGRRRTKITDTVAWAASGPGRRRFVLRAIKGGASTCSRSPRRRSSIRRSVRSSGCRSARPRAGSRCG